MHSRCRIDMLCSNAVSFMYWAVTMPLMHCFQWLVHRRKLSLRLDRFRLPFRIMLYDVLKRKWFHVWRSLSARDKFRRKWIHFRTSLYVIFVLCCFLLSSYRRNSLVDGYISKTTFSFSWNLRWSAHTSPIQQSDVSGRFRIEQPYFTV